MSRRVLLTGATGFVGRNALAPLLAAGFEVHAVSSRTPPDGERGVVWHQADLLDDAERDAVVTEVGASHLLHFAWYAEHGKFWQSPENERWRAASSALLRAFVAHGGERAVLAGTCAEYAWQDETHCVEGVTPLAPATPYGGAKRALWLDAEAYAADVGLSLAWGRIFFLYGPHEDPRRLVASVAQALVHGERAETGAGEQVRDFAYTPEVAAAFVALLCSDVAGAVNVVSGRQLQIREVVEAVGAAAGRPDLLAIGARPGNPDDPQILTGDPTRLFTEVGWTPALSFEASIAATVDWWRGR